MAEPLNATFFAFKRRERGGVLLGATIAYIVMGLLLIASFVALNWGSFRQLGSFFQNAASGTQPSDPSGVFAMFGIIGWLFIFLFFFYVLLAAYETACLKWMIRGQTGAGFFGLSLGADTWRVYSGYWMWFLISLAISFGIAIITMPILFAFALSGAGRNNDPTAMIGPLYLASFIRALVQYAITAFFAVRLAPGNATSILREKFSYFDAWKVTRGRFWALFGSFFVLGLIWVLVTLVAFGATGGALLVRLWPALVRAETQPSTTASTQLMATLFAPENIGLVGAFYASMIVTSMIFAVLFMGVNARAALAAVEDGKIEGITPGVAKTFE
ncbi:MAG: hypothetical protein ABUS57_11435 [Pseudomonadota bacterium]